jgi:hypothetical protein
MLTKEQVSFLNDLHVEQICMGQYQVILNLSAGVSVSIENNIQHVGTDIRKESVWTPGESQAPLYLQRLAGKVITNVNVERGTRLILEFSNHDVLTINKREDGLESYQITGPGVCIVI